MTNKHQKHHLNQSKVQPKQNGFDRHQGEYHFSKAKSLRNVRNLIEDNRLPADEIVRVLYKTEDIEHYNLSVHQDLTELYHTLEYAWSLSCKVQESLW